MESESEQYAIAQVVLLIILTVLTPGNVDYLRSVTMLCGPLIIVRSTLTWLALVPLMVFVVHQFPAQACQAQLPVSIFPGQILILSTFSRGGSATIDPGCSWSSADSYNNLYYGNCGDSVFLQNSEDKWCLLTVSYFGLSESYGLCLVSSEADCCEVAPGPTAGIAIALILLLAGIIACICRCCRCFCSKSKAEAPPKL